MDNLLSVVTLSEFADALRGSVSYARQVVLMFGIAKRQTSGKIWLVSIDDAMSKLPDHLKAEVGKWYDMFLSVHNPNKE